MASSLSQLASSSALSALHARVAPRIAKPVSPSARCVGPVRLRAESKSPNVDARPGVLNRRDLLAGSLAAPLTLTLAEAASADQEASEFVTFDNPKEKYTFQVPAGWVQSEGTAGVRKVVAFHPPDRTDANVTILITPLAADFTSLGSFGTVEAFAETLVNTLDRSWQPSPGQKAVLLGAKSANDNYLVEYTLQKPSEPCIHLLSAVATGQNVWYNNLFTLTGQYPEDEAATFKPTVDKCAKRQTT
ncbi:unnamed protein product [Closterium sp. Yama58-4]|nr:unnamed protein product [Closterium sp. Yama58-4]